MRPGGWPDAAPAGEGGLDGFPVFPPLPGGRVLVPNVRSLARLVAGIRTGVLSARTPALAAMVVFLDREPIDGIAVRPGHRVTGPEALDDLAEVPIDRVSLIEIRPELALAVGSYFLPTEVRDVPARLLVPETFVRSLGKPGQRGCVLVSAPDSLGFVFFNGDQVQCAYRQEDQDIGGLQRVAELFDDPEARVSVRVGNVRGDLPLTATVAALPFSASRPTPPVGTAPDAGQGPARTEEGVEPGMSAGAWAEAERRWSPDWDEETGPQPASRAGPGWGPASSPARATTSQGQPPTGESRPVQDGTPDLVEAAVEELRAILGPQAARFEDIFREAEPTTEGLRAAAESLRGRRVRLISPATLELAADRVVALLDRLGD
ncbi:MAG TPA: hypothetical protein VFD49_02940 [Candidatus Dormibacteraeota bacterium]|nr:hypothetical protein [Candidatus Dormibacteraeota bacterium]